MPALFRRPGTGSPRLRPPVLRTPCGMAYAPNPPGIPAYPARPQRTEPPHVKLMLTIRCQNRFVGKNGVNLFTICTKSSHERNLHRNRSYSGNPRHFRSFRRRHERRSQFPQLCHRLQGRFDAGHPHRRLCRHYRRRSHLERHDGSGPKRHVQSRTVHIPRGHDVIPGRDVRQHYPAGSLQLVGTAHLDHRLADLLPAGLGHRRVDLQDLERPRAGRRFARAFHQHLARHGYRLGDSAVGSHRLHLRYDRHVYFAYDLLVSLYGDLSPLRVVVVRRIAYGDHLFRSLQRTQIAACGQCFRRNGRPAPAAVALHLLGGMLRAAVLHPAVQDQHPAHHDPVGDVRPGTGFRRQRPGEFHRRTRRRIRRLLDRQAFG